MLQKMFPIKCRVPQMILRKLMMAAHGQLYRIPATERTLTVHIMSNHPQSATHPVQISSDKFRYIASLDASKEFDRINHDKLFSMLVKRGAPQCFVCVLSCWYSKLVSHVRCNGIYSDE